MSARLAVLGGTLLNVRGGLTPSPSHEYFAAIWPLSANAGLLIFRSAASSAAADTVSARTVATPTRDSVHMVDSFRIPRLGEPARKPRRPQRAYAIRPRA